MCICEFLFRFCPPTITLTCCSLLILYSPSLFIRLPDAKTVLGVLLYHVKRIKFFARNLVIQKHQHQHQLEKSIRITLGGSKWWWWDGWWNEYHNNWNTSWMVVEERRPRPPDCSNGTPTAPPLLYLALISIINILNGLFTQDKTHTWTTYTLQK